MSVTVTQATKSHAPLATRHSPLPHRNADHESRVNHRAALFLAIPAEDRRSLPGTSL